MTPKNNPPARNYLFGLTKRDIILFSLLVIIILGIGPLSAYYLIQHQQVIAQKPINDQFETTPQETPTKLPNTSPAQESTLTPSTTPTSKEFASQPSEIPNTLSTAKPTQPSTPLPPTPITMKPPPRPTHTPLPPTTPTQPPSTTPTATATPISTPISSATSTTTATPTSTTAPSATLTANTPITTVIFVQSNGQTHTLGVATSTGQSITNDLHRYAAAPAWSLGGATIAFFGEPGIGELGEVYRQGEGIWVIDPQGRNPRQLVNTDHVKNIAWSPDGSMLAYEFWQPDRSFHEVIIIDAGDGRVLHQFAGEQPAWDSDNQSLIVKACNPDCGLWHVDMDGKTEQQITFDKTDSFPTLSPDGQALSFASQRNGNWEIYYLELPSSELLRLTNRPGTDTTPVFSPDGREIYLRTDAFGGWRITALSLDESNERLIKEGVGESDEWGLARPAVY